jgi:hypothetical protein
MFVNQLQVTLNRITGGHDRIAEPITSDNSPTHAWQKDEGFVKAIRLKVQTA